MANSTPDLHKKSYPVLGMSCASCAASAEKAILRQPGVVEASVNYGTGLLDVAFDSAQTSAQDLQKAVQAVGYDLLVEEDEDVAQGELAAQKQGQYAELKRKTIWASVFTLPVFVIGMFFMHMPYGNEIMFLCATPVVWWFGRGFFRNAWKQLKHGQASMDTLVALSTGIAYLFSVFNLFFSAFWEMRGLQAHVYFEAAAVIITFILLGRLLEERAKSNTSSAIKKLMDLQPKTVRVLNEQGIETLKPLSQVRVGERIVVKPGDKIPVDGLVSEGQSYVDESMLNGEPLPQRKEAQSHVFAGTINQQGNFVFTAEKVGGDTLLAQIIQMVQAAQGSKAPVQKLVDKIAGIFVPAVLGISLLTLLIWLIFGGENAWVHGILSAVTVLVIACPCALGLATPTAIMVGIGKGAEHGILIKDAESLELGKRVNAVVLDKTGTITEGTPKVLQAHWFDASDEQVKQLLFSLERKSEHPLAQAICQHLEESGTHAVPGLTDFETQIGEGVAARFEGVRYFAGSRKFLEKQGISFHSKELALAETWAKEAYTLIWFAQENRILALLGIADQVKDSSIQAIRELKSMGVELHMLTGDHQPAAKAVANQVGIDFFQAEVLPQDKAGYIAELQKNGLVVAMVGDGINDSTALAQADVSMAMGKGSDIAIETAKMTLIASDLQKIPYALRLSKQTVKTIRQNLFWAFIYNVIGIPLAAGLFYPINGFLLNPMIAGAAMALSSVSVVGNSLRLKWLK